MFAAVGSLHMIGPKGLPALLRQRGYRVEQRRLRALSAERTLAPRGHNRRAPPERAKETDDGRRTASFAKMVPGFDFLQSLVKNAGAAIPGIGQWVAPTLDPDELEKRIDELRTVQFWLEQNARMLATTIQALEVQKMTLSTLKTMNVQMGDLRESLKLKRAGRRRAAPPRGRARKRRRRAAARPGRRPGGVGRPDAVVGRAHQASSPSSRPRR